jgi:hypothetical protein
MGNSLLSLDALAWLKENGYRDASHEERTELIRQAKEIFPSEDD